MSDASLSDLEAAETIPRIRTDGRGEEETDFRPLRAYAIARSQAASGKVWTDYNIHDPGVTILEAFCYALTDLVYQADFPVADHLSDADGEIDFARQALFPPQTIFPSRATTVSDYRRVLLDKIPALADARVAPAPGRPGGGLLDLSLLLPPGAPTRWADWRASALAAFRRQRGLGEDVNLINRIKVEPVSLQLDCTLGGPRDPAELLAQIYDVSATTLTPPLIALSVQDLIDAGHSLEEIFTGPGMEAGFIDAGSLGGISGDLATPDTRPRDELFLNTLRSALLAIPGVQAITGLALIQDSNGREHRRSLVWQGDVWVPHLRTPLPRAAGGSFPPDAADLGRVRLWRRSAEVTPDPDDVAASYADIRAGRDAARRPDTSGTSGVELPRGAPRAERPYYSIQNLLPPVYRLGDNRHPDEAVMLAAITAPGARVTPPGGDPAPSWGPREARVAQLKAYLALFDQMLANASAQLQHIRDLFTPYGDLDASYRRDVLANGSVRDIETLYGGHTRAWVADQAFRGYDDAVDRLNKVLDYLLALYGEEYPQNTQRQFMGHLDSVEQARLLLANKAAFLRHIDVLSRDRAEGVRYDLEPWGDQGHTPGLHRRIALLLGFADPWSRRLSDGLADGDARPVGEPRHKGERHEPGAPLEWPLEPATYPDDDAESGFGPGLPLAASGLPVETMFTAAVDRQAYLWRPGEGDAAGLLWLGGDPPAGHAVAAFKDQAAAAELADRLRDRMLALNAQCEGLHIVEHILLRPRSRRARWSTRAYGLRVTLVFPAWTVRTARPDFRAFARETAEINCPAHMTVECVWLDIPQMRRFEAHYEHWMTCLRAHRGGSQTAALDKASAILRDFLRPELRAERARLRRARRAGRE